MRDKDTLPVSSPEMKAYEEAFNSILPDELAGNSTTSEVSNMRKDLGELEGENEMLRKEMAGLINVLDSK